ncbi:MAG: hypothetical protein U1E73_10085 [Planctomycetota bacterium]
MRENSQSKASQRVALAAALMQAFAERSGLSGGAVTRRYLWTDAFAVDNFLALHRGTGVAVQLSRAQTLVQLVHEVLGRQREDAPVHGFLSGLDATAAREHPTVAGLRIGKPLAERGPAEPFDAHREWDRDGQYLHYLTQWGRALLAMHRATADPRYHRFAVELLLVAHAAFAHDRDGGRRALYWKMSCGLDRPLVASMGQHDAVDALVLGLELQRERALPIGSAQVLAAALADLRGIADAVDWTTTDALGIGGLLITAGRLARVARDRGDEVAMLVRLLDSATVGLDCLGNVFEARLPELRPAFREIGLAIGLRAVADAESWRRCTSFAGGALVAARLRELARHEELADRIEGTWCQPHLRSHPSWTAHLDIDEVMLASLLLAGGGECLAGEPGEAAAG